MLSDLEQQAFSLHRLGKLEEAKQVYLQILSHVPQHTNTLAMLGVVFQQQGDLEQAIAYITQAIALNPLIPEWHNNLGNMYEASQRFDDALASYDQAIALRPQYEEAYFNRGLTLQALKRWEEALAHYDHTIALNPRYAKAYAERGIALHALNRLEEAIQSYDYAIALDSRYAKAHANRGNALKEVKRFSEALASYDHAIAHEPDNHDSLNNKALLLLLLGRYAEGWPLYEHRKYLAESIRQFPQLSKPLWQGEDIQGKTIVVYHEQGLGDTLQFCRYIPLLARLGAQVVLGAPHALRPLLRTSLQNDCTFLEGNGILPAHYDYHCPLLSLPLIFQTRAETIPAQTPYLCADWRKSIAWKQHLSKENTTTPYRIGLAWSGSTTHANDHNRSLQLAQLQPLMAWVSHGVEFHCLQKEIRSCDVDTLNAWKPIQQHQVRLHDFSDTAALIEHMDVVITVDTSIAHLAGAMGKTTFILLPHIPDWRWLLDRSDSPWYPTARLFRQPVHGDWDSVIQTLSSVLQTMLPRSPRQQIIEPRIGQ